MGSQPAMPMKSANAAPFVPKFASTAPAFQMPSQPVSAPQQQMQPMPVKQPVTAPQMPMKPPTVATTAPAFTPTTPAQPAQSATATTAPAASKPDTEGNSPNPFAKTNTQTVSKPAG